MQYHHNKNILEQLPEFHINFKCVYIYMYIHNNNETQIKITPNFLEAKMRHLPHNFQQKTTTMNHDSKLPLISLKLKCSIYIQTQILQCLWKDSWGCFLFGVYGFCMSALALGTSGDLEHVEEACLTCFILRAVALPSRCPLNQLG